jgi:hypothetical protein
VSVDDNLCMAAADSAIHGAHPWGDGGAAADAPGGGGGGRSSGGGRQKQEAKCTHKLLSTTGTLNPRARLDTEKWFKHLLRNFFSWKNVWTAKPKSQNNVNRKSVSVTSKGTLKASRTHRRWNRFVSSCCVSNRL